MVKVTYTTPDGSQHVIDAKPGVSVMETAVQNGVPGIVAECGGACACATCHVYVHEEFTTLVAPPGDFEDDMLDDAASERRETSRLSCQIKMTEELADLHVEIPPEQQ